MDELDAERKEKYLQILHSSVVRTKTGRKFHRNEYCGSLSGHNSYNDVYLNCIQKGLQPCDFCQPGRGSIGVYASICVFFMVICFLIGGTLGETPEGAFILYLGCFFMILSVILECLEKDKVMTEYNEFLSFLENGGFV